MQIMIQFYPRSLIRTYYKPPTEIPTYRKLREQYHSLQPAKVVKPYLSRQHTKNIY